MNGGTCLNGLCKCRAGFDGDYCQIAEYTPSHTNYSKYLKIFLFYMVMVIIIIALLAAAYVLFNAAKKAY